MGLGDGAVEVREAGAGPLVMVAIGVAVPAALVGIELAVVAGAVGVRDGVATATVDVAVAVGVDEGTAGVGVAEAAGGRCPPMNAGIQGSWSVALGVAIVVA